MIPAVLREHIPELLPKVAEDLPLTIDSVSAIGGGCIHNTLRLNTSGGSYFIKYNHKREFENFESEYRGLDLMRSTGEIRVPVAIAKGTAGEYAFLLMEFIESGNRDGLFWKKFGRELAAMHRHTQDQFGLDHSNFIGALPQKNEPRTRFLEFFIEMRLEPQLELATSSGLAPKELRSQFETLYKRLNSLIPDESPALLHGDLWSGNFMCGSDLQPVLIDPAVHYGHREAEIAMTRLFGGFSQEFYWHYQESFPMENDWESRSDLYNLYPLMVHLNLFGRSYLPQVQSILANFI